MRTIWVQFLTLPSDYPFVFARGTPGNARNTPERNAGATKRKGVFASSLHAFKLPESMRVETCVEIETIMYVDSGDAEQSAARQQCRALSAMSKGTMVVGQWAAQASALGLVARMKRSPRM